MHKQNTVSNPDETPETDRADFGDVFGVAEFRALWLAQLLSVLGDQLARVAVTLLVYEHSHSALLAAVTFAASVVPAFVGGVTLAGLADRFPRRRVMITCDIARAAGVVVMTVPGIPLAALVILLFTVTMVGTPFNSARAAVYPEVLAGDWYVLGNAVTLTTNQLAQVAGFAAGGAIVGLVGVRVSLLADAVTFAVSAVLIRIRVRARPTSRPQEDRPSQFADLGAGLRLVFATSALRTSMLLGWLAAFYNAPEGIAAPLAQSLNAGKAAVGLILAATALGASIGAVAFSRMVRPPARLRWMRPLAIASCAVLILFALRPGLPLALGILFCSGVFDCFQVAASAVFITTAPPARRSQAVGLASAGMSLGQGTAMILAGAAAQDLAPSTVIAAAGALGAITAAVIAVTTSWQKRAPIPRPAPDEPTSLAR